MCFAANNILLMRNHALVRKMSDCLPELSESDLKYKKQLGDRIIKRLLNSIIAKYRDWLCLLDQLIDLLTIDKSRYFDQPRVQ